MRSNVLGRMSRGAKDFSETISEDARKVFGQPPFKPECCSQVYLDFVEACRKPGDPNASSLFASPLGFGLKGLH